MGPDSAERFEAPSGVSEEELEATIARLITLPGPVKDEFLAYLCRRRLGELVEEGALVHDDDGRPFVYLRKAAAGSPKKRGSSSGLYPAIC